MEGHKDSQSTDNRRNGDTYSVSDDEVAAFRRDGYVHLRAVMSDGEMDAIEAVYDRFLRGEIEVTGKASREMLQPKQFINCTVSLDEFGKVTEPALQLAFTDGGTPGVMAGGLGIAEPGAKRVAGKRPAGSYLVAGTIKQVEGDVITVIAGREKFDITVPPEAELVVRSTNVGLASPDDHVEVEGKYYQKGQLLVSALKITLSNPVVPPPPKNKARRR